MQNKYEFICNKITTQKDLDIYKNHVNKIEENNPFYAADLAINCTSKSIEFHYFCFDINNRPAILLPYYKRKIFIDGVDTGYFDAISPYGYSGPLYDSNFISEDVLVLFWKYVDNWYASENIVSEFTRFSLSNNTLGYSGTLIPSLKNVRGKLINTDDQWDQFKSKVRNNYRRAEKENLKLEIFAKDSINDNIIDIFHNIYTSTMERNNAEACYFYSKAYFENFINNNPDSYILAMVFKDDTPISTELILTNGETLYSFLGGTMEKYFNARPNDFLKVEITKWAFINNFKYYVLGGGRKDNDNLYSYKKSFFPKNEDIIYYTGRKIINSEIYNKLVKAKCSTTGESDLNDITNSFFPYYRKDEKKV